MTNLKLASPRSAFKKLLLALPLLAVIAVTVPSAQADDHGRHHGRGRREYRHEHYYRHHGRHHGYYHGGRYYSGRRYYYRGGHRYYRYYGLLPEGISVNIGLYSIFHGD